VNQGDEFYKHLLDNLQDGVYFVDQERRITFWSRGAERLTGYTAAEVTGAYCWNNLLSHVDSQGCRLCTGECPLVACIRDGQERQIELFLHHKAGHRIPVMVRVSPVRNAQGAIVGAVETFSDAYTKISALDKIVELEGLAFLDAVTGVGNRRYVEVRLHASLEAYTRYGWPFGLVFLDLDHFKKVNDTFGHEVGDKVLSMVARTLGANLRSTDSFGRWGGEEFLALISNPSLKQLCRVADRCRRLVMESALKVESSTVRVTVSAGAAMAREGDTAASLVERVDRLMYRAKAAGRNRVEFEEPLANRGCPRRTDAASA
jgi:diguanylate cyclase (GGDEF)-like protein/PAS domain S-box-containing protein